MLYVYGANAAVIELQAIENVTYFRLLGLQSGGGTYYLKINPDTGEVGYGT
jgi:hypothetical protein